MSTEAMKLALEALEKLNNTKSYWWQEVDDDVTDQLLNAETALQEALAEQPSQQEPVAWIPIITWRWNNNAGTWEGLTNTSPPAQEFVCSTGLCHYRKPLADEEIEKLNCVVLNQSDWNEFEVFQPSVIEFARAIEAAHGIKENT